MIDRERLLADDHQARLHEEARLRRQATAAVAARAGRGRSGATKVRLALGQRLVSIGRRLDTETDPCGSVEVRPA